MFCILYSHIPISLDYSSITANIDLDSTIKNTVCISKYYIEAVCHRSGILADPLAGAGISKLTGQYSTSDTKEKSRIRTDQIDLCSSLFPGLIICGIQYLIRCPRGSIESIRYYYARGQIWSSQAGQYLGKR